MKIGLEEVQVHPESFGIRIIEEEKVKKIVKKKYRLKTDEEVNRRLKKATMNSTGSIVGYSINFKPNKKNIPGVILQNVGKKMSLKSTVRKYYNDRTETLIGIDYYRTRWNGTSTKETLYFSHSEILDYLEQEVFEFIHVREVNQMEFSFG